MKKFVINCMDGDSIMVNVRDIRGAVKIAKENGRNLAEYNGVSSMYFIWDENEENLLCTVHTFKLRNEIITKLYKPDEN